MKASTRNRIGQCLGVFIAGWANILPEYAIAIKVVGFGILAYFVASSEVDIAEESYRKGFETGKAIGKKIGYGLAKVIKKGLSK